MEKMIYPGAGNNEIKGCIWVNRDVVNVSWDRDRGVMISCVGCLFPLKCRPATLSQEKGSHNREIGQNHYEDLCICK